MTTSPWVECRYRRARKAEHTEHNQGGTGVGSLDLGGGAFIVRVILRTPRRQYSAQPLRTIRLSLEALEARTLPTNNALSGPLGPVLEAEPNDTIDQAQILGSLTTLQQVEIDGAIGRGAGAAADVDWYRFRLDHASAVSVATRTDQLHSPLVSVLSLYGSTTQNSSALAGAGSFQPFLRDDGACH